MNIQKTLKTGTILFHDELKGIGYVLVDGQHVQYGIVEQQGLDFNKGDVIEILVYKPDHFNDTYGTLLINVTTKQFFTPMGLLK